MGDVCMMVTSQTCKYERDTFLGYIALRVLSVSSKRFKVPR
jgi:hypothetical protein